MPESPAFTDGTRPETADVITAGCYTRRNPVRRPYTMLSIRELAKTYSNGVQALANVTLEIPV